LALVGELAVVFALHVLVLFFQALEFILPREKKNQTLATKQNRTVTSLEREARAQKGLITHSHAQNASDNKNRGWF
jgi:hypothetical protein